MKKGGFSSDPSVGRNFTDPDPMELPDPHPQTDHELKEDATPSCPFCVLFRQQVSPLWSPHGSFVKWLNFRHVAQAWHSSKKIRFYALSRCDR